MNDILSPRTTTLPPHVAVFDGPNVWMEGDARAQLTSVAMLDGCIRAVGMPDLHPGRGYPIGAVVATRDVVYPQLVGGDAGCGARVVVTAVGRASADWIEKRVRAAWDDGGFHEADSSALFEAAFTNGPRGLEGVAGLPDALRALAACESMAPDTLPACSLPPYGAAYGGALGSIGGGNHFAEISKVTEIIDEPLASRLGLERNALVVLVHSGSRGLGTALASAWGNRSLRDADRDRYLGELAGACRFARANRFVLAYRLLAALGALRPGKIASSFDVTHNDVRSESVAGGPAWVHRKGAAPAYGNELTVVLGSRGAPSSIMRGHGDESALRSVAHGAGRKMGRSEAREKIRARYRRTELARSPLGGRLVCDSGDLLLEEHPDAYKAIAPVIAALETHGLASRVAALTPVVTVKL